MLEELRQLAEWVREAQNNPASANIIDIGDVDADLIEQAADEIKNLTDTVALVKASLNDLLGSI